MTDRFRFLCTIELFEFKFNVTSPLIKYIVHFNQCLYVTVTDSQRHGKLDDLTPTVKQSSYLGTFFLFKCCNITFALKTYSCL